MSRSHSCATAQNFPDFAPNLEMFPTYEVISCVICKTFIAQNFKTKVLTAQEILLLECLDMGG